MKKKVIELCAAVVMKKKIFITLKVIATMKKRGDMWKYSNAEARVKMGYS